MGLRKQKTIKELAEELDLEQSDKEITVEDEEKPAVAETIEGLLSAREKEFQESLRKERRKTIKRK